MSVPVAVADESLVFEFASDGSEREAVPFEVDGGLHGFEFFGVWYDGVEFFVVAGSEFDEVGVSHEFAFGLSVFHSPFGSFGDFAGFVGGEAEPDGQEEFAVGGAGVDGVAALIGEVEGDLVVGEEPHRQ